MNIELDVRHLQRHDTEENWNTVNPILMLGEVGYVTTGEHANMSKLGDGVTPWNSLPFTKAMLGEEVDLSVLEDVAYIYKDEVSKVEFTDFKDADTLGGNLPEYYGRSADVDALKKAILALGGEIDGTQIEASEIVINPTIDGITSTNIQGALSEISNKVDDVANSTDNVGYPSSFTTNATTTDWIKQEGEDNTDKWYVLTVSNANINESDTVLVIPTDEATKENIFEHVKSIIETYNGGFKVFSNEILDTFNVAYIISKTQTSVLN